MTKANTWFQLYRAEWIMEMLRIYGFINREHLMRKFGTSKPQASIDLREFRRRYPTQLRYDVSQKCYVAATVAPSDAIATSARRMIARHRRSLERLARQNEQMIEHMEGVGNDHHQ